MSEHVPVAWVGPGCGYVLHCGSSDRRPHKDWRTLLDDLVRASQNNSGAEPSLSVYARAYDAAVAALETR